MTAPTSTADRARSDWRDLLTPEERRELMQVHPWRGLLSIAFDWAVIFAALALVAWAPNPLTIVLALFLIGARQLGLAVIMHEAAHGTLLKNRRWNDWCGNWLAAYPVWSEVEPYRRYHLVHHAHTATERDPDLSLVKPFPITRGSFARKVWRDLSGQTGWKQTRATFLRDVGWRRGTRQDRGLAEGERPDVGWHKLRGVVVTNAILLAALAASGHPELYLLWVVAWFTTNRLCTRLRAIAEHALCPDPDDPLNNTRTTRASWWERLFVAPNYVNYHLEHHLLMSVPMYNLPRLHRLLSERGALDEAEVVDGYRQVLERATARPEPAAA